MAWPKFGNDPDAAKNDNASGGEGEHKDEHNDSASNQSSIADQLAAALNPVVESIKAQSDRMAAIEGRLPKERPANQEVSQPVSVFDDENAAFNARITPVLARQLELEARVVKNDIRAEYAELGFSDMWHQYAADIDKILNDSPLVDGSGKILRGDPQYIRNTVDMVFGRAARTKGVKFNAKDNTFFLEGSGSAADHVGGPENIEGMTAEQRKVFERMGVPLADGKNTLNKLKFIN